MTDVAGGIRAFGVAGAVARGVYAGLRTRRDERFTRKNYAGRTVDLYSGPAVALGALAGSATLRTRAAGLLAVGAGALCGAYDDLRKDHRRGFRDHLTALRSGEVTSGAVKLIGIGGAGLVAGALLKERPVDKVLAGVVVAGTAHLVNLVDLRPGRATGLVLALGAPGSLRGPEAAVPMGAAAAILADDLGERTMIGDSGAHALGAALGVAIAGGNGRTGLAVHAAGLLAAAAWAESRIPR
uniref:UDP-N-acetylmuramyl pentapeptide phosphotransferase/UDP-N-acetylglucosamine-1-phosphate transferase n=1 Tax=Streptomyces sp. NBC_00003 TaxID=2903608 RepID=A0AAU2VBJ5_9ACTN